MSNKRGTEESENAITGDLGTIYFKICRSAPSAIQPLHHYQAP